MTRNPAKTILVVEDEWLIAESLESILTKGGHEVLGPAPTVSKAMKLLAGTPVDAAVLDVSLGEEKSYPVALKLLEQSVPVLFLTGYVDADLPPEFQDWPMLHKPVVAEDLLAKLNELISR